MVAADDVVTLGVRFDAINMADALVSPVLVQT